MAHGRLAALMRSGGAGVAPVGDPVAPSGRVSASTGNDPARQQGSPVGQGTINRAPARLVVPSGPRPLQSRVHDTKVRRGVQGRVLPATFQLQPESELLLAT